MKWRWATCLLVHQSRDIHACLDYSAQAQQQVTVPTSDMSPIPPPWTSLKMSVRRLLLICGFNAHLCLSVCLSSVDIILSGSAGHAFNEPQSSRKSEKEEQPKKKRKKCVAHISSQLVSTHQQSLSWLFDHKFIACVAGAWDTVLPSFLMSVWHREGNLSKHYDTVHTTHAELGKRKSSKKCTSAPRLLKVRCKCSSFFLRKRSAPTSVPAHTKSQSPCLLWTVPSAFSHQPSKIIPVRVKHWGIWTTGDVFAVLFSPSGI